MGYIKYPNSKDIKGPWLINQNDFEKLDNVIITISELLEKSWISQIKSEETSENKEMTEQELEKTIQNRKRRAYANKHNISCQFTTKDGHKLFDKNLTSLLKDNFLKNLSPNKFTVNIIHGSSRDNAFVLSLSDMDQGKLHYEIEAFDTSVKDEIQYEIDKWVDNLKPNTILQIWSNYFDILAVLLFIPLIFLTIFSFSSSYTSYDDVLKKQGHTIIKHGVDSSNINSAIELLLKSETDYAPKNFVPKKKQKKPVWIKLFIIVLIVFIISIVRPRTILGVGNKKRKLNFYKFWIKFVTITLPSVIIIAPLWEKISTWFY